MDDTRIQLQKAIVIVLNLAKLFHIIFNANKIEINCQAIQQFFILLNNSQRYFLVYTHVLETLLNEIIRSQCNFQFLFFIFFFF